MKRRFILTLVALGGLSAGTGAGAQDGACLALRGPLGAGQHLTSEAVEEVACREGRFHVPLTYDRSTHTPVTTGALPAGTYLGRVALRPGTIAAAGEPLELLIHDGPVMIARTVRPLQAARSGEKVFVKAEDGTVLVARFIAMDPAK